jgi:hypothetical protein
MQVLWSGHSVHASSERARPHPARGKAASVDEEVMKSSCNSGCLEGKSNCVLDAFVQNIVGNRQQLQWAHAGNSERAATE